LKKILSLILIASILLTGTVVFANENTTTTTDRATSKITAKSKLSEKLKEFKNWVVESMPQTEEVRSNKTKFEQLKVESKTAYDAAKRKVKEMLKNKDSMTPEQIDAIKQAVSTLTKDKEQLGSTLGNIGSESLSLKIAKKDKNIAACKQALKNIIAIQNKRISDLKAVIDDMKKIAAM
jgi:hypothetical protein